MYIPKAFEVTDQTKICSFIEANAFGQLISSVDGRPYATHIPFLLSEDKTKLLGHLANQNPQTKNIEGLEVLVTLQGPHDYVSPSWYSSLGVPTWNYQAAHIYGECQVFTDEHRLADLVNTLTAKYEAKFAQPWQPEYKPAMLGAIIGIEIAISEIQCKYKLSQNRSLQDQKKVVFQLKTSGSNKLAEEMERNIL